MEASPNEDDGGLKPLRVLVTGSRSFTDREAIRDALEPFNSPGNILIHGACPDGADKIAAEIWTEEFGLVDDPYPAEWSVHRKRAGFVRNARMVALGPDVVLAFIDVCEQPSCKNRWRHGSHGATGTVNLAEKAGIGVRCTKTPALIAIEAQI